ncbi:MAG: hypothetical protein V2A34_04725 [Lentisphaerota bacterium]
MRTIAVWAALLVTSWVGLAGAEDMTLFSAKEAGADVWVWDGAKLTSTADGQLNLSFDKNGPGNVYLTDRFLYWPSGVIDLDAAQVAGGTYTLQILAFKAGLYLGCVDLVNDSTQTGLKTYPLSKLKLPAGTETLSFKFWISKTVGASILFNDLKYRVSISPETVLYDARVNSSTRTLSDLCNWTVDEQGGVIGLTAQSTYGSVVFLDQITKPEKGILYLELADVKNGTLTVQGCAFDASTNYLDSVDMALKASTTINVPLDKVAWPAGTSTFQIKVWMGGVDGAKAMIKRILVLK